MSRKKVSPAGSISEDQLESQWRSNRLSEGKRMPARVNGKKIAAELGRLYDLTGDPAFQTALLVLKAYGLDQGSPQRTATRLRQEVFRSEDELNVLELMHAMKNGGDSARNAARKAVASYGYDGGSYQAVAEYFRKRYSTLAKQDRLFTIEHTNLGTTDRTLDILTADPKNDMIGLKVRNVPDSREWRRKAAEGTIWVRYRPEDVNLSKP